MTSQVEYRFFCWLCKHQGFYAYSYDTFEVSSYSIEFFYPICVQVKLTLEGG